MKRLRGGFSLVEVLVAVAVFAALAVAAWGGLAVLVRTRAALAERQARWGDLQRAVGLLERDLRQSIARSVRDAGLTPQPALGGDAQRLELTRLAFAHPPAVTQSALERVIWQQDGDRLRRGRYAVLDRTGTTVPQLRDALNGMRDWRLRYLGCDAVWRDFWPPRAEALPACSGVDRAEDALPRAVEFRFVADDVGDIRRVIELPSALPRKAAP